MGEGSGRITKQERTLHTVNESKESIHTKQMQFDFSNKQAFSMVHWHKKDHRKFDLSFVFAQCEKSDAAPDGPCVTLTDPRLQF